MMIDSGSCLNVIDEKIFRDLSLHKTVLKPCDKKLWGYGGTVIPSLGQFRDVLHSADKSITDFVVVKDDHGKLLSGQTANTLGLLHLWRNHVNTVSDKLVKYPILKQGIGKLNDQQIHLYIDHSIQPTYIPQHRRIPFHQWKKVEVELARLEREDIIERVEGQTPWVSPILVVPKPVTRWGANLYRYARSQPCDRTHATHHAYPRWFDSWSELCANFLQTQSKIRISSVGVRRGMASNHNIFYTCRYLSL